MARKWPVHPVSAMSVVGKMLVLVMVEAEGPSGGKAVEVALFTIGLRCSKTVGLGTGCVVWLGTPCPQVAMGVAS
jgi:hypothetical protein